jgi:PAS domain S-box-containing protein
VITRPDREKHIAEMSVVEISWEGSPAYLASLHDITKRKQMEEDLRASEGKYRNIVELAQDSIVISSPLGTITSCNKAFLNLIGFSEEEVVGKNFTELPSVHTIKNPEYLKLFTSILSGDVTRPIEMVWQRRDGTTRISELRASVMKSNDKITGIQALVIDITERKKAEETLRESEEKFSAAFRSSPDIIAIVNMKRGMYVEVNDSYTRATGYTRKEMIGRPVNEIDMWVKPEESEKMTRLIQEQGKITNEEFTFRMKSGEIRQWLCSAEMINIGGDPCVMSVATDITERKQMEKAIRESEEKFSKAFHSSANSFAISKLKDGKFIEINESFTHMTGYTREEAIGHNADNLGLWASEEDHDRIIQKTRDFKSVHNEQIKTRSKSGEIHTGLFSSEQITIGGEPCFINTITDITELKRAEESVRVSEEKFSKAFLRSPEAIIISNIEDGTIFEANDTFLRLTGYTREEVIGKKTGELDTWAIPEQRAEMIKTLIEKGAVNNKECLFCMKSGELRTWLFSAEIINIDKKPRMLSVTTDITERKKAEEELRFSDTALKSIHEGVFALDNEFKITRWNEMCEQMFAIKASEAIGKSAADVINMVEDYPGQNEKRINLLLEKGFNKEEQIYRTPRGDIWVDVQAQAMEENGKRYGWITLLSDITERKRAEEKFRESEEKFRSIVETSSDQIFMIDKDYKLLSINQAAADLSRKSPQEMIGRSIFEVFPENIAAGFSKNIKNVFDTSKGILIEEKMAFQDREFYSSTNLNPIKDDTGNVLAVTGVVRDITERKQLEQELQQSRNSLLEAQQIARVGSWDWDILTNIISYSDEFNRIFGQHIRNFEAFLDSIHPDDRESVDKSVNEALWANKPYDIECRIVLPNEEERIISAQGRVTFDNAGKPVRMIGTVQDITERRQVEEKLKQSEEKYRDLFENASDLIQSCTMEGKCIYVNKAWRDALGYSEKEVLNIIFWNIVHPDYLVHCKQAFQRVISGETVNNIQTAFVAKNGRLIQVEGNVNPVRKEEKVVAIRAIFRDITERKEAEEKLLESEERYRDLFENANDLIQSVALDGHFMYVNTAWREALGYTEKEVEKLIIWDIVHPDYVEHCKDVFQKVTTCETVFIETAFIAKNKKVIFVEGNANCYSHEGKIIATRGIFRDVTERKLADEKIRRIDEMKSEFLSNISHELRTPLQSISGFTKLIMNGQVPDPATQQEFFQIIDRETMHLGNLINGLLDMSRLEAGRFQINKKLVPIRDTFIDPIKMFHSLAHDKNITLSEDIPREIPEMEVDNERMRQVVINLVGNAIKFSDPGSSVAIKVEKQPGDLLFQVSDHGTGIREKDMMHLFERFYRAEGETVRGGTGLGLYISKQIVDAHGGRIWAESKFGEGSTFSFTLPLNGKGGNGNGKKNSGH